MVFHAGENNSTPSILFLTLPSFLRSCSDFMLAAQLIPGALVHLVLLVLEIIVTSKETMFLHYTENYSVKYLIG